MPRSHDLTTLATAIAEEHAAVARHGSAMLEHARRAGELLIMAKGQCAHGQWMGWVEGNFRGSARTARAYMRVAARWEEIEANRQTSANLSIDEALRAIASPREPEAVEAEPVPNDVSDLERRERKIVEAAERLWRAGKAMEEIRSRRLWRAEYGSWAEYCDDRGAGPDRETMDFCARIIASARLRRETSDA